MGKGSKVCLAALHIIIAFCDQLVATRTEEEKATAATMTSSMLNDSLQ